MIRMRSLFSELARRVCPSRAPAVPVRLPFAVPPPIWSYAHHAIVSGIGSPLEETPAFFANHYINLRCPRRLEAGSHGGDTLLNFEPTITVERLGRAGFVDWKAGDAGASAAASETVAEALRAGFHVVAIADKRFVPGTPAYGKFANPHWVVLFEHRPGEKIFGGAAYVAGGAFGAVRLSDRLLRRALASESAARFAQSARIPRLQLVGRGGWGGKALDLRIMARQFADFLDGRDTSNSYLDRRLCNPDPPRSVVYGQAVYEPIRHHFRRWAETGSPLDLRATRVLLEHKELMRTRVGLMRAQGHLREAETPTRLAREGRAAAAELHLRSVSATSYRQAGALTDADAGRLIGTMQDTDRRLIPLLLRDTGRLPSEETILKTTTP